MINKGAKRSNIFAFIGVLTLSSATMLWLFWRFPVGTCTVTFFVLAAFAISARLARAIDVDQVPDGKRRRQRA